MRLEEASKVLGIPDLESLNEKKLRECRRKAIKFAHPDNNMGVDPGRAAEINVAYCVVLEYLKQPKDSRRYAYKSTGYTNINEVSLAEYVRDIENGEYKKYLQNAYRIRIDTSVTVDGGTFNFVNYCIANKSDIYRINLSIPYYAEQELDVRIYNQQKKMPFKTKNVTLNFVFGKAIRLSVAIEGMVLD